MCLCDTSMTCMWDAMCSRVEKNLEYVYILLHKIPLLLFLMPEIADIK